MKPELYSAIIAASSALRGVAISQIFSMLIKAGERRHEQRVYLRKKFEDMAFHFLDSFCWLKRLQNCSTASELRSVAVSKEAQAALVICQLYFPLMVGAVERYVLALQSYYLEALASCLGADPPIPLAVFVASSHNLNKELFDAKNEVLRLLKIEALQHVDAG